jgi:cell wall-associated NlpC family hydrolase
MTQTGATPDRRITAARSDLADERLRGRVEADRYVAGTARRVAVPVAPLRAEPRPDCPIDTQLLMGEPFTVFEEDGEGFSWGQSGWDGYVGYLASEALGPLEPEPTHRVAAVRTFVYPGPSLKLPTETCLSMNALVSVVVVENGYARLTSGGFVHAGHLVPVATHEPDFVAVAERFLHTPYLWGGKTSIGLDCSALVQMSLMATGVAAPRDSDMQEAGLGVEIPFDETLSGLRRGDLVFWKGHVGILRDAQSLIHANGHHMAVAIEGLAGARDRIREKSFGPITSIRRLEAP